MTHGAPPTDHGHAHGHGKAEVSSRRVRRLLALVLAPFAIAALVGVGVFYPFGQHLRSEPTLGYGGKAPVEGKVLSSKRGSCTSGSAGSSAGGGDCLRLRVRLDGGPAAGRTIEQIIPAAPGTPKFAAGDAVVLSHSGADPTKASSYQIVDFQRGTSMVVLAVVFAVAVLVLGRWQGLAALVALGLSFTMLVGFVLPAILAGEPPLPVAVVGAGLIMFTVLYLTHGFSARTSTAVLGTLLSLGLIGALSILFSALTDLTGLDENTSTLIGALGTGIDTRGLLLAGIVIGALGVLDDVTVTQTSAVWELRKADPGLSWRGLYSAGLRIGRDHVSSAVNTLVLAYAGASLPLLLAYSLSGRGFTDIVTSQAVAQEAVRTLVGSIGLIAAVPITTAIAAGIALREDGTTTPARKTAVAERVRQAALTGATLTTLGGKHR